MHGSPLPVGEATIIPLDELPSGARGRVKGLKGGNTFVSRMASLGLSMGSEVTVRQNYGHGPLIILARDTRLALGRGEARKILVEETRSEREPEAEA